MPKHAVKAYGLFIRQALSRCPIEAAAYAKRLSDVLEGSWSRTTEIVQPVDIPSVLVSFKPRSFVLSDIAKEYLTLRDIDQKPPTVALSGFISLAQWSREFGHFVLRVSPVSHENKSSATEMNFKSFVST